MGSRVVYTVILSSLLCVNYITLSNCNQFEVIFEEFVTRFRKSYTNGTVEYQKRLEIFQRNYKIAQFMNHNRTDNRSAWFGITKFSDLTYEEFKAIYLSDYTPAKLPNISQEPKLLKLSSSLVPNAIQNLPKRVDWRDKQQVTKVKDQGDCGGCWAFSSIELLESKYAAQTGRLQEFSIQEVIDCSRNIRTPYGQLAGCEGGQLCAALFWLNVTQTTIVPESKYKYRDRDEYCMMLIDSNIGVQLEEYNCLNYKDHEIEVLKYLAMHGPVAVAVDASNWHNYLGGIVQYHCSTDLNHAVQIIGYDISGPVPYYIVRNSWGENWGLNGYIHVKIGDNMCGIATEVTMVNKIHIT